MAIWRARGPVDGHLRCRDRGRCPAFMILQ